MIILTAFVQKLPEKSKKNLNARMAQFFMSRARKLFQYVDLQGSTVPSPASHEGRVTSSMSSNGDATVRIDDVTPIANSDAVDKSIRQRSRRRKFLILAAVCGVAIVTIIALTYHDNAAKFISAIPATFSSASHSRRVGYSASVNSDRRVTLADITRNKFNAKKFNGSWISDHEIMFPDSNGGISIMNAVDGMARQVREDFRAPVL